MTEVEFGEYWTFLVDKRYPTGLSDDERTFYAANIFRGAVPRSGLVGYFEQTECSVIRDAHDALAVLRLTDALRLLEAGQRIILRDQPLPESQEYLSLFGDELSPEEYEQATEALDSQIQGIQEQLYLQDEPIFDALCRFADEKGLRAPTGESGHA